MKIEVHRGIEIWSHSGMFHAYKGDEKFCQSRSSIVGLKELINRKLEGLE